MQALDKLKLLGLLALRLAVAVIFLSEGYAKLFSASSKWVVWFHQHGFPSYVSYGVGSLEFFGGVLLILGLLTRFVGLLLAIEMAYTLVRVSVPHSGIYNVDGYAQPLLLGAACFALFTTGAGLISVDAATFESSGKARGKSKK